MRNRKPITVLKHHRTSDVYIDGRYLVVSMKISLRSKRGREIGRETAQEIMGALATDPQMVITGHEQSTGNPISSSMEDPSNGGS